jgi:hypothetical protein
MEAFTLFQEDAHMRLGRFALVAAVSLAAIAGCPGSWDDSKALGLVGVNGPNAYFVYSPEWSGFEMLPSSFWKLDLDTATATRVYDRRVQYDVQLAGDYAVAERPTNNNQASEVVAKSLLNGDETVILERDVKLGGRYYREFIVDGTNVVARTATGLLVYDLVQQAPAKTIPVLDELVEIYSAGAGWAIATRNDVNSPALLISLDTDAVHVIPDPADGFRAYLYSAAIVDEYVYVSAYREASAGTPGIRLLALHISTLTWSTLADYGETRPSPWGDLLYVTGADATNVLAEFTTPYGSDRIELVARASGERTTIAQPSGGLPVIPLLQGGRVYWLSNTLDVLNVYDIAAGTRNAIPVPIPD